MRSAVRWLLWAVFRIYIGEIPYVGNLPTVMLSYKTLLGAAALCQRGCPPLSDASVFPALGQLPIQVNTALSFAPPPPWGQGWRKGRGS